MTTPNTPTAANLYGVAVGTASTGNLLPFVSTVSPGTTNVTGPNGPFKIGQEWVNTTTGAVYILTNLVSTLGQITATWTLMGTAAGTLSTLTGDSGGAISPSAGNINLLGTANQITTTGAGSTITWSIPATFIAPGSIASTTTVTSGTAVVATTSVTAGTTVTATLGAITATNGNLVLGTAGNKIVSTSVGTTTAAGANSFGSVVLTNGTATVATTAVTASSLIILSRMTVGTTGANDLGVLSVGTIVAATSFIINAWTVTNATALQADDQSVIMWVIIN